jgi:predicted enzyme related to lactoylglutathione lyase
MAKKSAKPARRGGKPAKKAAKKAVKKPAKKSAKKSAKKAAKSSGKNKKTSRFAEAKMNPVVHFEIPMDNPSRVSDFYREAFGWNTIQMGEEHGGYILAQTGETRKDGMLKETGMINGGFKHKDMQRPAQYPTLVIAVFDLKAAVEKVEKAGGKIVGNPIPIPGYGTYITFVDTEGNRLEMIEPDEKWKEKTSK